jgi:hypothetical protein
MHPRLDLTSLFKKFVSAFSAKKHRTDVRDETHAMWPRAPPSDRPQILTLLPLHPLRFLPAVSPSGCPAKQVANPSQRGASALGNLRFKSSSFETAFGHHASGMVRGERPRLHQAPPIRGHPWLPPSEAVRKRRKTQVIDILKDSSVTMAPHWVFRGHNPRSSRSCVCRDPEFLIPRFHHPPPSVVSVCSCSPAWLIRHANNVRLGTSLTLRGVASPPRPHRLHSRVASPL